MHYLKIKNIKSSCYQVINILVVRLTTFLRFFGVRNSFQLLTIFESIFRIH